MDNLEFNENQKNDTSKEVFIILADESIFQSWLRDASSLVMAVAMTGIGRVFSIAPLEWIGGGLFIVAIFSNASALKKAYKKTPQQAADFIMNKYGVYAEKQPTL